MWNTMGPRNSYTNQIICPRCYVRLDSEPLPVRLSVGLAVEHVKVVPTSAVSGGSEMSAPTDRAPLWWRFAVAVAPPTPCSHREAPPPVSSPPSPPLRLHRRRTGQVSGRATPRGTVVVLRPCLSPKGLLSCGYSGRGGTLDSPWSAPRATPRWPGLPVRNDEHGQGPVATAETDVFDALPPVLDPRSRARRHH